MKDSEKVGHRSRRLSPPDSAGDNVVNRSNCMARHVTFDLPTLREIQQRCRFSHPFRAVEKDVQHNVDVEQDSHFPYFFSRYFL